MAAAPNGAAFVETEMPHQYAQIAFTPSVRQVQLEQGSAAGYAGMLAGADSHQALGLREQHFIQARDSFYMASVSETGWPYLQHRGGPVGFVRVLDEQTLGFADFQGNRQYISTGNFRRDPRVALFFMDYPNRSRLKLFGRVRLIDAGDTARLAALEDPNYRATVERGFLIEVMGFDWNCPQHIRPRYTEEEIEARTVPLQPGKAEQQAKRQVRPKRPAPTKYADALGRGPLELVITAVRQLTPRVRAYELRAPDGSRLPKVTAGAHLTVPVRGAGAERLERHYSICSNPARRDIYEIAVLSQGTGSEAIQADYGLGLRLRCAPPRNQFALHAEARPAMLIAGGIGITAIKPMAQALLARGQAVSLHYAGRDRANMAFVDRLSRLLGDRLSTYPAAEGRRINVAEILAQLSDTAHVYVCGPSRLIEATLAAAESLGIDPARVHFELFGASLPADAQPFHLTLKRSAREVEVAADQTVLDALLEAGVDAPQSCRTGVCRTCVVQLLEGEPEHRDTVLSAAEHAAGLFCPCVSRARGERLLLDM